ncbi:hypothetical protein ACLMNJ_10410 [Streptomyces seoulensis]
MRHAFRRTRPGAWSGAVKGLLVVVLGCALGACSAEPAGRRVPYWVEGTTPAQVARRMDTAVPAGATDVRAARQKGFQDDGLLLAFTLPRGDTEAFVRELRPDSPLGHRARPLASAGDGEPAAPFAHLGLPEPEALADVTEGPVCTPCRGELNSLAVAVHPLDAQHSRVYLRGVD